MVTWPRDQLLDQSQSKRLFSSNSHMVTLNNNWKHSTD